MRARRATPRDVAALYERASAEALSAFGDGTIYVEKFITPARHVEIQVLCDNHGTVLTCGERECSIQRRHQKLIEESPSPALERRAARGDGGRRRARVPPHRLPQRGHDRVPRRPRRLVLVHRDEHAPPGRASRHRARLRRSTSCASRCGSRRGRSSRTAAAPARALGHVIEMRINAEDPANDFAPAPGTVTRFRPPLGPGVRVDTFIEEGSTIPPFYDSLIAKVIVKRREPQARDRPRDPRARRVRDRRRADDVRGAPRHPRERRVPERRVLDVVPRGGGGEASVAVGRRVSRVLVNDDGGSVRVSEAALVQLVDGAVAAVDGARLRRRRRLSLDLADGHARAELEISAAYGSVLPEAARAVQEQVADALTRDVRRRGRRRRRRGRGAHAMSTISRREARRAAVFILFQSDVTGQPLGSLYDGDVDPYTERLAQAVTAHAEAARRAHHRGAPTTGRPTGSARSSGTSSASRSRSSTSARCRSRSSLTRQSSLAKRYASEDAAKLVNGILGRIVRER